MLGGIPRALNILCDNALITSFGYQKKPVTSDIVDEILRDFKKCKRTDRAGMVDISCGNASNRRRIWLGSLHQPTGTGPHHGDKPPESTDPAGPTNNE